MVAEQSLSRLEVMAEHVELEPETNGARAKMTGSRHCKIVVLTFNWL
jgi:hypothetical protein